jgi:2-succinyl-5-enolpyruvyl-6-hydroxy-3-cyclohexene-1-carboxylate synthase
VSRTDPNALWARAFVEELARAGVRDVCVAPGSRSTPLVLAFAAHGGFRTRVHLDERSAGFFALGVGKATGVPAAVLTTSGTATANLFPAVMEASQGETPLLVLTADRPHRLRDSDANQAVDQLRLYGPFVREFFEVAPPALEGPALRHLRTVAARAVASAVGLPAGPVHLNFPLDRPLEPVPGADDSAFAREHPRAALGRADGAPFVRVSPRRPLAPVLELNDLSERLGAARRPLLVAGPSAEPGAVGHAAVRLARETGFPLLGDPLSGARYRSCDGVRALSAYDLFLRAPAAREALRPDLVLRVGRSPTSATLLDFLADCGASDHVVVDPSHRWKDHLAEATEVIRGDAADALLRLAEAVSGSSAEPGWAERWRTLEAAAGAAVERALEGEPFEGLVARLVLEALPPGGRLFVSNSMPIREVETFGGGPDRQLVVLGNRGASGIDGIVSTALGVAAGSGDPVVALVGDIALLHDANGLLAARERDARVVFVVVNNDGGAIFHFLPVRAHEPHFTPLFATPHGLEPARVAALYGLRHERAEPADVGARVRESLRDAGGGSVLVEVRSDREANRARREAVVESVRAAVTARLVEMNRGRAKP